MTADPRRAVGLATAKSFRIVSVRALTAFIATALCVPGFGATQATRAIAPVGEARGLLTETPPAQAPAQEATTSEEDAQLTREAAEQGVPEAQNNLAAMYARGRGVPRDDVEAVQWYRNAAEQGSPRAQHSLGQMYAAGDGVPPDMGEAVRLNRLAAEQGHRSAQNTMGLFYAAGRGVPQDYVEAHKWHDLAASGVTGDRQKEFAEARDALAKGMTSAQLAEAQKLAREWQAAFEKRQADSCLSGCFS